VDRRLAEQAGAATLDLELVLGFVGRIEPAQADEAVARRVVKRHSIGLADLEVGPDAEPGKILLDAAGERFGRALAIGVVEAEDIGAAGLECIEPVEQRRPGVTQMQAAGGGWCVADDGGHCTPCFCGACSRTAISLSSR